MAKGANVSQLLKIAKRRMEESFVAKEKAIRKELGISFKENERTLNEATARVKATIAKDLEKLNLKFLQAINNEVKNNNSIHPHVDKFEFPRYGCFYHVEDESQQFHKRVQVLKDGFKKAYEDLELTLALADSPAALKEQFEAFLKLIA